MAKRFLRFPQLAPEKGVPYSFPHLGRLEKQALFPRRVHLGPMTVAWDEEEIDAFLASKVAERDKEIAAALPNTEAPIPLAQVARHPAGRMVRRKTPAGDASSNLPTAA